MANYKKVPLLLEGQDCLILISRFFISIIQCILRVMRQIEGFKWERTRYIRIIFRGKYFNVVNIKMGFYSMFNNKIIILKHLCQLVLFFSMGSFVFFSSSTLVLVGCSSCSHQDRPGVQELNRSHGVGPQTLGSQCGTYFRADGEVKGVIKVCLAKWA